jgi:hypothetical protein
MRELFVTVCLSFVVVLMPVSSAVACINDSVTVKTESEFRKHYEFKSGYQEKGSASPSIDNSWGPVALGWQGASLLVAAVGLMTINLRRIGKT